MKLRKARKAPKRFDDYGWEEDHKVRSTTPSPKTRARPATRMQPHNPLYNPNIGPAAFPTLDHGVSRKANSTAVGSSHAKSPKSLVLNTKIRSQIDWLRKYQLEAQKVERARIPVPPPYKTPADIQPGSMYDNLFRLTAQRKTAEIIYHQNHPGSDVYVRNMGILKRMAKRTADDWNILEMITSDEEELSPVSWSPLSKSALTRTPTPTLTTSAASWDKLPAAHQLDLVHTMSEIYGTVTEAMQKLRLDNLQTQRMLKFLERHPEPDVDEVKHVAALEAEKLKTMLFSGSDEDDQKHSRWANAENFTLSTSRELAKAKAYLELCGKRPVLLDHWKSLLYDYGSRCDKNRHRFVSSLLAPHEVEKARSFSTPQPERPKSEVISTPCAEALSQKPLFKTPDSPIKFLYPISPDSIPPPHKLAKLDGRKIARYSYPAAERSSATPSPQRALAYRRQNLSPASSSLQSDDYRDEPSVGGPAIKNRPMTDQGRKKISFGSSSLRVGANHRLLE